MESENSQTKTPSKFQNLDKTSEDPKEFCRICLDVGSPNNPITSPCSCSGSIKYIHEQCLKKWILMMEKDPSNFKCDLCKARLKMEFSSQLVFSCKRLKYEILKIILLPIIFFIFSNFIVLIVIFLSKSFTNPKISSFAKAYVLLILISCIVIDLVILWNLFQAFKKGCFQKKIVSWKIFDKRKIECLDYTILNETGGKAGEGIKDVKDDCGKLEDSQVVEDCCGGKDIVFKIRDRLESGITECPSPTIQK